MQKPTLDPRLLTAADFFPYCEYGADIGADHGHLSCYLLSTGKCKNMVITDISDTSLDKARTLIRRQCLEDRAQFHCGDGLKALPHPVNAIAICGMGGHTVSDILINGQDHLSGASLILSPQTEHALVRSTLYKELGYHLEREQILRAANRYYIMLLAAPGKEDISDKELFIGPRLAETVSEEYLAFVKWRCDVVSREQHLSAQNHLRWLKEEYERVRIALLNGKNS